MSEDNLPMKGVRVLDLATFLAGPFCGTILGEFGAEVIKIEQPKVGDPLRKFGTIAESGEALIWLTESRNKKSITLDLRQPEGAEILKRLVSESDVLIENFRTGTLEKWGVGWETLKAINPKLVMLRITGFGQTGPKARDPGFARIAHAFSGLSYLAGEPDGGPLMPGSTTLGDYLSGTYGALGVLMALRVAERNGEGQYVDIGLYEPVFRFLDEMASVYAYNGYVRERMGADTVNVCPHSHYPTKDGKWIAIACTNDRMFARLANVMEQPELAQPDRFEAVAVRLDNRAEVNRIVTKWTSNLDQVDVLELCRQGEVPSGPIHNVADIFADPQYKARENLVKFPHEGIGEITMPGVMPRLSATPGRIRHLGPALGEHIDDVLGGLLGIPSEAIAALRDKGVI
ncbi:MAG: crotonobetainyl-CoA:carnitine CoA-transferase CaiB-like acyl-CoA transferase [Gammaproteobacteria bacterium]